jgi:hypothetical protein
MGYWGCTIILIFQIIIISNMNTNTTKEIILKELLQNICDLVETDFCADMDMLTLPDSREYTQEEAKKMAHILGVVYLYAHQIHCSACGHKNIL